MDTLVQMQYQIPMQNETENKDAYCGKFTGDSKKFRCNQCGYSTDRRNNLTRHMKTMHTDCSQVLECCFTRFTCKAAFRAHVKFCHQGGYVCPTCPRVFCRKALLKRHLSIHNGYKEFSCSLCEYATSHKSNLQRHARIHCKPQCPSAPQVPSVVNGHFEEPMRERLPWRLSELPYKCAVCGQRYPKQETLRSHVEGAHPIKDVVSLSIVSLMSSMAKARFHPTVLERPRGQYRIEHRSPFQQYRLVLCSLKTVMADNSCKYQVIVLKEGYSFMENGQMRANGTSTLIKGKKNIIVDTLSPADKDLLLKALDDNGVKPSDIDIVVGTHGHVDHIGNLNLFPKSTHIIGFSVSTGDTFYIHPFEKGEPYEIDEHITVLPTPGHTLSDISVVVSNVAGMGTVVVAGDLFERKEDVECPNLWLEAGSEDPKLQEKHRREILALADYVVPGHGPMFKVDLEMKGPLKSKGHET